MAIVKCPKCDQKISDKAKQCPHCQVVFEELDEQQLRNLKSITKLTQAQKITNHSFIAMLLFCGGFGFMYWNDPAPDSIQQKLAIGSTVIGFFWYIISRFRLVLLKRK